MPGRRGRCRRRRWVSQLPEYTNQDDAYIRLSPNSVCVTIEELEIIRLIDLENLTQQEASAQLGISRKTLWNDLQRVRRKVAHALIHGHPICVSGGYYKLRKNDQEV
jgi:uncharacterized protein